ncbi:MAG TPA: glycosyl hydrolase 115 family protein [Paludibacter sp.]|nr:glycosyl hydrolase 115 family protein [Paludibacter sp.]
MNTIKLRLVLIGWSSFILTAFLFGQKSENQKYFPVVSSGGKAVICVDEAEASVVSKAIGLFRTDVAEITGQVLSIQNKIPQKGNLIVAGTLGKSKLIKQLVLKSKLNMDSVVGKWEAFSIQTINMKQRNILVVIGSDRRGTAYGVLELSRMMGVSPWIWWADVKPVRKSEIVLNIPKPVFQKPTVQYRGIFLNDEDWGLKPWASKTIEPEVGEIGPKTYRRIFELLLRLRANTIWPAMHECSMPFYYVNGNAAVADSFGIVVSTSHCEPMMRSNPREWNHETNGAYNFFTNKEKVIDYWTARTKDVSGFENVYTVGMRGIHDGAMEGAKTVKQQVSGLEDVFVVQRKLLADNLHKSSEQIPQIFIPYKEVLDAYNAGLKVPDDVTLVWCDDNYGYLTRLSNAEEQTRSGGSGVYYHLSYWGRPHDYLWLATMQPAFIWTEMHKAWEYGARKMWILNVGDIKPSEYLTEFYLDMAWDINSVKSDGISQHLENWLGNTFGRENAEPLKDVMNEYYRLAFIRRPEFMGWSQTEPNTKVKDTDLSPFEFGNEIATRLKQYDRIESQAEELERKIPVGLKDAYFELIKYPVCGAAEMNKKWLNRQMANTLAMYGLPEAERVKRQSLLAYEKIQQMTAYYNDSLSNGKWKYMMSYAPRKLAVFDKPVFTDVPVRPLPSKDSLSLLLNEHEEVVGKPVDCIHFNASEFSSNTKTDSLQWKRIDELGYSRSAMVLQPFGVKPGERILENPSLEYQFTARTDSANVFLYLFPTHALDGGNNQRIGISIDGSEPAVFNINTIGRSNVWKENVLRNQAVVKFPFRFKTVGKHTLRIYAVDPDMVVDQLLIDFKLNRKFYGVGE